MVCWESGFNNVGVGGSTSLGNNLINSYAEALAMCESKGLILIPVRIEYSTGFLDLNTLEPTKYNIFYNTLAVNLARWTSSPVPPRPMPAIPQPKCLMPTIGPTPGTTTRRR